MRFWFSGPRLFRGMVRPGISFGPEDFRRLGIAGYAAVLGQIVLVAAVTAGTSRRVVNRTLASIAELVDPKTTEIHLIGHTDGDFSATAHGCHIYFPAQGFASSLSIRPRTSGGNEFMRLT